MFEVPVRRVDGLIERVVVRTSRQDRPETTHPAG